MATSEQGSLELADKAKALLTSIRPVENDSSIPIAPEGNRMAHLIDEPTFSDIVKEVLEETEFRGATQQTRREGAEKSRREEAEKFLKGNRTEILKATLSEAQEFDKDEARLKDAEAAIVAELPWQLRIDPEFPPPMAGCLFGGVILGVAAIGAYNGIRILQDPGNAHWAALATVSIAAGIVWWQLIRRRARAIEAGRTAKGIPLLRQQLDEIPKRARESAKRAVREVLRTWISRVLEVASNYALALPEGLSFQGLAEQMDTSRFVSTSAKAALYDQIDQMPCGTIGIAGPRGAGKTTLLKHVSTENAADKRSLSIFTSVPVGYEGRDFILHLFATTCREVLADLKSKVKALSVLREDGMACTRFG